MVAHPRRYWVDIPDRRLSEAAAEYLTLAFAKDSDLTGDVFLIETAVELVDEYTVRRPADRAWNGATP
jgi:hypothetical protein